MRLGVIVAAVVAAVLIGAPAAPAVVDDHGTPEEVNCPLFVYDFDLEADLATIGLPVANASLQIDASDAKLVGSKLLKPSGECVTVFAKVPEFRWAVAAAPAGQSAALSNADTLAPTVKVGGPGAYRVRFTACPNGCTLRRGSQTKQIGSLNQDVTIDVSTAAAPPPDTAPAVPLLSPRQPPLPTFSHDLRDSRCSGGGGFADPEWVTTEPFRGPVDYQLVEGPTTWSRVADLDNFLNHDSEDFEWKVDADPPYTGLTGSSSTEMKMEWETGSLPDLFRPTPRQGEPDAQPGDRTSVYGYWIFDCGHDSYKTEIHPPVGMAVQRPRPIRIPPSFRPAGFPNGFGSNVWVPGVVTDIWFNRHSGGNATCDDTGLSQPAHTFISGCLRQPHPLDRKFTFNVYLPRSPQQRAEQQLGMAVPAVPLFVDVGKLSGGQGGPEPGVVVRERDGITWLEVTVDLTGFGDQTYARRLTAGWAYPQPDNWGAQRWRVNLEQLRVIDDAEPAFDDGDWRLYFNTNNGDQEWTELFSCDGCVDDDTTYQLDVSTGTGGGGNGSSPSKARSLGPDPVVFPGQNVLVHTTGYDDEVLGDDVGTVYDTDPQASLSFTSASSSGDGSYRLVYSLRPVGSVGRAVLTPEAQGLLAAYSGSPGVRCGLPVIGVTRRFVARVCTPARPDRTFARRRVVPDRDRALFENESEERDEAALTGMSAARMRREFRALRPEKQRRLVRAIRHELGTASPRLRGDFDEIVTTLDRALPARVVRRAVPPAVRRAVNRLRRERRAAQARGRRPK